MDLVHFMCRHIFHTYTINYNSIDLTSTVMFSILEMSTSMARLSPFNTATFNSSPLGRAEVSPSSVNPIFSRLVFWNGFMIWNETDVVAWNLDGTVWNESVRPCPGLSTRRRVNSATPLTNCTRVTPPSKGTLHVGES